MSSLSPRIPLSTYRLQFNASFTFLDAARLIPYLDHLGITDCYGCNNADTTETESRTNGSNPGKSADDYAVCVHDFFRVFPFRPGSVLGCQQHPLNSATVGNYPQSGKSRVIHNNEKVVIMLQ